MRRSFETHVIPEGTPNKNRVKGIFGSGKHKTFEEMSKSFEKTNNLIKCKGESYDINILKNNISLFISGILETREIISKHKNNPMYEKMCFDFLINLDYQNIDYANIAPVQLENIYFKLYDEFYYKEFFLFTIGVKDSMNKIMNQKYRTYKY